MTGPQIPDISYGNLATDVTGAAGGFAQGLIEERRRRQQLAMQQALQQATIGHLGAQTNLLEAQTSSEPIRAGTPLLKAQMDLQQMQKAAQAYLGRYPDLLPFSGNPEEVVNRGRERDTEQLLGARPGTPTLTDIEIEPGRPIKAWAYPPARGSNIPSTAGGNVVPSSGIVSTGTPSPRPIYSRVPSNPPAPPGPTSVPDVFRVPTAPGQGTISGTGTPSRISPSYGYLSTPRPSEVDAATWAPGVLQGFKGMRDILAIDPNAAREAIPYLNSLQIAGDIPAIGNTIASIFRALPQSGLSPAAQNFVQHYIRFRASRVFAAGGKQLTGAEMREATAQYIPAIGEDPSTVQQRIQSMAADVLAVLQSTGRAWTTRRAELIQLGAPDLGEFDPMTQRFSNLNVTLNDLLRSSIGGVAQPNTQKPRMNPRFAPTP